MYDPGNQVTLQRVSENTHQSSVSRGGLASGKKKTLGHVESEIRKC